MKKIVQNMLQFHVLILVNFTPADDVLAKKTESLLVALPHVLVPSIGQAPGHRARS